MGEMVQIEHLHKRFGTIHAVDDLSFEVARGEILGFLGPNGAGKSTTMKMITGFLTPDAGTVRIGGRDIAQAPLAVKRRLGYLPEGAPLYSDMTPASFLDFIADIRGLAGSDKRRRIGEVVERVHLHGVLHQPMETLSKGYKRRVGLAQAIVHDPEVLVLDEPTDGLDPNQKHEVRELIRSMAAQKVIVLSTHILEEVEAVCTRAIIIAGGKLLADGTPSELEARAPTHGAVRVALYGDDAEGAGEKLRALPDVRDVQLIGRVNGRAEFRVYPQRGASVIDSVAETARTQRWRLDELHTEHGRLDEVFREITTTREHHEIGGAP